MNTYIDLHGVTAISVETKTLIADLPFNITRFSFTDAKGNEFTLTAYSGDKQLSIQGAEFVNFAATAEPVEA